MHPRPPQYIVQSISPTPLPVSRSHAGYVHALCRLRCAACFPRGCRWCSWTSVGGSRRPRRSPPARPRWTCCAPTPSDRTCGTAAAETCHPENNNERCWGICGTLKTWGECELLHQTPTNNEESCRGATSISLLFGESIRQHQHSVKWRVLTSMARYRPGSRAILANSSASSLKDGRESASNIQPASTTRVLREYGWNSEHGWTPQWSIRTIEKVTLATKPLHFERHHDTATHTWSWSCRCRWCSTTVGWGALPSPGGWARRAPGCSRRVAAQTWTAPTPWHRNSTRQTCAWRCGAGCTPGPTTWSASCPRWTCTPPRCSRAALRDRNLWCEPGVDFAPAHSLRLDLCEQSPSPPSSSFPAICEQSRDNQPLQISAKRSQTSTPTKPHTPTVCRSLHLPLRSACTSWAGPSSRCWPCFSARSPADSPAAWAAWWASSAPSCKRRGCARSTGGPRTPSPGPPPATPGNQQPDVVNELAGCCKPPKHWPQQENRLPTPPTRRWFSWFREVNTQVSRLATGSTLLREGEVPSCRTLMATGTFTFSPSGMKTP